MTVATFADGGESCASLEFCASLKIDIRIITNVSVETTGENNGTMYFARSKPVELNAILFCALYGYMINRANSNEPNIFKSIDSTFNINDTTYLDVVLNTSELGYTYRIDLYSIVSSARLFIGFTQRDRSMRLMFNTSDNSINFGWNVGVLLNNNTSIFLGSIPVQAFSKM